MPLSNQLRGIPGFMDSRIQISLKQPQQAGERGASPLEPRRLVINAGDHLEVDQSNITLPYQHVKMLGHGSFASVEMVRDVNTGLVYARKEFKHVTRRNLELAKQDLRNEVQIMQRLSSHHHIVRVHATYIMNRELGILLSPVADSGDLQSFLQDFRDHDYPLGSEQRNILEQACCCLANGLAFIHQQTIRHKDIKPSNILIHQGNVLYTDFGLSSDFSNNGQSTTTGISTGHTKRYCAPEVVDMQPRNSKSDVFSLGCVMLEILQALFRDLPEHLFDKNFHETVRLYSEDESFLWAWGVDCLLDLAKAMLQIDPIKRPNARGITFFLEPCSAQYSFFVACGSCNDNTALNDIQARKSRPLPPQSTSEPLWRLVNDSIRECTKHLLLRETVTPREIAQWVVDNDLGFLLSQRCKVMDWLIFYRRTKIDLNFSWKIKPKDT